MPLEDRKFNKMSERENTNLKMKEYNRAVNKVRGEEYSFFAEKSAKVYYDVKV